MKNRQTGAIALLSLMLMVSGCAPTVPNEKAAPSAPAADENARDTQSLSLKSVITNHASAEQKQTPVESVLHQIEWKYSNDELAQPDQDSVLWDIAFGEHSVVVVEVPHTASPWYNFIFLSSKESQWNIQGFADAPVIETSSETSGLALPMEKFTSAALSFDSDQKKAWVFADEENVAAIGKYPRTPLALPAGSQEITVNGSTAWMTTDSNHAFLYYFDKEFLVWVGGTMSETELQQLAASLPSSTSPYFPANEQ